MDEAALPIELVLLTGILFGAGMLFLLWRLIVALRTGTIWLRRQAVRRADEPAWFFTYLITYLGMIAVMLMGLIELSRPDRS